MIDLGRRVPTGGGINTFNHPSIFRSFDHKQNLDHKYIMIIRYVGAALRAGRSSVAARRAELEVNLNLAWLSTY
jgi:hypothetical protein